MRILYYGIGGGTGHLIRGISVLRKFKNFEKILITSSKFSYWAEEEGIEVFKIPSKSDFSLIGRKIRNFIVKISPSLLFVDTFPSGCFGELKGLNFRKIFIKRTECKGEGFDMVFDLKKIPPVLIRDGNELMGRDYLRRKYEISNSQKVLFFYHNTNRKEVEDWANKLYKICDMLKLKFFFSSGFSLKGGKLEKYNLSYFPVLEILPMADIVVTGGGYNSYMEVSTLFNSAIFIPFFRKIDHQDDRIDGKRFFKLKDDGKIKKIIEENFEKFCFKGDVSFENGADYIFERTKNFLN